MACQVLADSCYGCEILAFKGNNLSVRQTKATDEICVVWRRLMEYGIENELGSWKCSSASVDDAVF